jgi:hypothetical protein
VSSRHLSCQAPEGGLHRRQPELLDPYPDRTVQHGQARAAGHGRRLVPAGHPERLLADLRLEAALRHLRVLCLRDTTQERGAPAPAGTRDRKEPPHPVHGAVLRLCGSAAVDEDVSKLLKSNSEIFAFTKIGQGVVDIRDFQTTGVVAFARGCPFYRLASGKLEVMGKRIQVNESQRQLAVDAIDQLVALF